MSSPSDYRLATGFFGCEHCGAPAHARCTTVTGHTARYPHASRYEQIQEVVRLSGWMAEEEHQRKTITALRGGLIEIRDHLPAALVQARRRGLLRTWR